MKKIKIVSHDINGNSKTVLETRHYRQAYLFLKRERKEAQRYGVGTTYEVEGMQEYDLSFLADGFYEVAPETPIKHLGGDKYLHLELGITLKGEIDYNAMGVMR